MILYCFTCEDCGNKWEEFKKIGTSSSECLSCGSNDTHRDYLSEGKRFFDDIPAHFNISIGEYVSGRRDMVTKFKSGGFNMLHGKHGCDITQSERRYYGDEEYAANVLNAFSPQTEEDKRYEEDWARCLEKSSEDSNGTPI